MPDYLQAVDVILTKPGGLTSTEAAAAELPMVHTSPIPGCETVNRKYFGKLGMSVTGLESLSQAAAGVRLMEHPKQREQMQEKQRKHIPKDAAYQICRFLKEKTER